jgi:hypothetical protein
MTTFQKFNCFNEHLGDGLHHLKSTGDMYKVYLSNDTPVPATDTVKADVVPITEQFGYAAADIVNEATQTGGVLTVTTAASVVWTASGGSFGPFRYAVIYNSSCADPLGPLVGFIDYGVATTVLSGGSYTVSFGASLMTIT